MLVSLDRISVSFGEKLILHEISQTIEDRDRIGLIGANGIGKSTLLNVICGRLKPDYIANDPSGVYVGTNVNIGLLEQNSGLTNGNTIYQEMRLVFQELLDIEQKMRHMETKMALHDEHFEALNEEYSKLSAYYEAREGYQIDVKIKTILNGMGFYDKYYETPINTLSGGEKTRLALAKLLLEEPQLLILDEPTNHLDFKTLMWLEDYLTTYKGGILVVSHDRYFLDKMVTKIWEIENKKVISYNGNYSKYKLLREERVKRELKEYETQQNRINSMREYAEKNIVRASTSNMAKSRLHQLEHIEVLEKPIETIQTPHFNFQFDRNPVKDLLAVEDLSLEVGMGENKIRLCDNINFEVKRNEKVALIGPNGIGKSTLLKAILGLAPQKGSVRWGGNVKTSYYEQENKTLNPENTALEELWSRYPRMAQYEVRNILGQVLLTGDNVFKKINVLSGGERARVAFAVMMLERGNTLILDEPTNHLDLQSKESLEKSLVDFEGTMIFVSHDRYFLNTIPTKIIELSRNGLKIYNGNFDFYLEQVKKEQALEQETLQQQPKPEKEKSNYRSKQDRREEALRKSTIKKLEELLETLDEEIKTIEAELATPEVSADYEKLTALCAELEEKKSQHDDAFLEWAELNEE
ncbi:ABC-F family ATP-binding cassette domain-containing protein [Paludicola sp. MB14-C6]|uniref:ABC-F family ATP-binding cassette domain-containing protein n=1 Tax=Paludihabitans sp. MB14-C6 TaxID=3070656 RepID=UPI0027DB4F89|nr:ABC-F family ATP-binding cassette domain-containing protein [Paludicola sp. MB14-C6]WMJ22150.1 ABC-F family ATP-binding cassette domain-containing protein [Paludicola sp. MB14-C6]